MYETAHLIREFRRKTLNEFGKPYSQMELALKIGWQNPSTLCRIEKGTVKPTRETILKIGKTLKLSKDDLNLILKSAGYILAEPELTIEYLQKLYKTIRKEWNDYNIPYVLLQDVPALVICWNDAMEKLLFYDKNLFDSIEKEVSRYTHIDIIFREEFGVRPCIVNWDEFAEILVKNMYVWDQTQGDEMFARVRDRWLKEIPEFKKYWDIIAKENTADHLVYNIPFVFRHSLLGEINFLINTFLLYEDKRFMVEQFVPVAIEDMEKMKKVMKG